MKDSGGRKKKQPGSVQERQKNVKKKIKKKKDKIFKKQCQPTQHVIWNSKRHCLLPTAPYFKPIKLKIAVPTEPFLPQDETSVHTTR